MKVDHFHVWNVHQLTALPIYWSSATRRLLLLTSNFQAFKGILHSHVQLP